MWLHIMSGNLNKLWTFTSIQFGTFQHSKRQINACLPERDSQMRCVEVQYDGKYNSMIFRSYFPVSYKSMVFQYHIIISRLTINHQHFSQKPSSGIAIVVTWSTTDQCSINCNQDSYKSMLIQHHSHQHYTLLLGFIGIAINGATFIWHWDFNLNHCDDSDAKSICFECCLGIWVCTVTG